MGKYYFSRIKPVVNEDFPYAMGINFKRVKEQKELSVLFNKLQRNQSKLDVIKNGFKVLEERRKAEKDWFDDYKFRR